MAGKKNRDPEGIKTVCRNKRALHDYEIHDALECGLVLKGTEVKSLRESSASLDGAYAKIEGGELWLINSDIPEYSMGNRLNHKPKRPRKLLLHRREISRILGQVERQGFTLVPLRVYFKGRNAKVDLGLARGKKEYDKRDDIAKRESKREIDRIIKSRGRE